ncbi:putative amidohydrolase [Micromonospora sp. A202]|uniref:nitrilase-related carbon-nitrogen hydrolase n=1 Tax=Micromonospora sp. A202 TaxID=2572899 RepID=UPI0011535CFA|nr:nitrilase-related carbon-nitrogen hydrolase [Micromonospora sp. A202]TQJ21317.1 putative amidohydrolase [Micromonospora sp. A202]
MTIRVAAIQFEAGQDIGANLATCLRLVTDAARQGAQLVVLPEFCNHLAWYTDRAQAHALATRPGDDFLTAISASAAEHRMYIKINVTHAYPDGRTGGTNFLFGPDGALLGSCDKQVLMGAENDHLDPATEVGPVLDTPIGRLGMYACMEGVIPETTRGLTLRGAQVLLNSLNSFATDEAALHIPVRAAENRAWVIAANKVGPLLPAEHLPAMSRGLGVPEQWLHGAGESQIVAPDGTVLAKGPRTGEAVVIADIAPERADDKHRPDGSDILAARRPELYGPLGDAPTGRRRPPSASSLPVAVVRPRDPGEAADLLAKAVAEGALLAVLAENALGTHVGPAEVAATLAPALRGTNGYAVATARTADGPVGLLIGPDGVLGEQPQLHRAGAARDAARPGGALRTFDLPWGRLAIVVGDDAIFPETFRLAALADADVVAVPFTPREPWELALGLPERAAENRLNVIAAGPLGTGAAVFALSADFTLWTTWAGPFTGRISSPLRTDIAADRSVTHAVVAPAQAANRLVSRRTDLVDGRPWRLVEALTERR